MLRGAFLALSIAAVAGCSNGAPSDDQVKQALFDFYATGNAASQLKQALGTEVSVKSCQKDGEAYLCIVENKALNASNRMLFVLDKSNGKWKFTKEVPQ